MDRRLQPPNICTFQTCKVTTFSELFVFSIGLTINQLLFNNETGLHINLEV